MLRSFYSGISSLRAHQTMLDVTGNNIANVNTTGFKTGRVNFQDTLSQMIEYPSGPQGDIGGTNPAQVGLGVQVGSITNDFGQGSTQSTGRGLDMMINGDGFFVIQAGNEQLYTRNGAFSLDAQGMLVTQDGALVQGWMYDNAVNDINMNRPLDGIQMPVALLRDATQTTSATFSGNLPADATDYDDSVTPPTGTRIERSIQVQDSLGANHTLGVVFTKNSANEWEAEAYIDHPDRSVGTLALQFNANGQLTMPVKTISVNDNAGATTVTNSDGTTTTIEPTNMVIEIDLATITGFAGLNTINAKTQNGMEAGTLVSYTIDSDGTIMGAFSNNELSPIGRVAVAAFDNPSGLEKAGGTMWRRTVNSGEQQVGVAGEGGRGTTQGLALEMSNVDLSLEFTNLILAQRGFQAGSRVITTSDEVLQELINLKR